jgi:hypothetical protein
MDTSVLHFYPTLFVLAMDIMDMLGDMVWERIKCKAEFAEDGTRICSLPGLSLFWISLSLSLSLFLFSRIYVCKGLECCGRTCINSMSFA